MKDLILLRRTTKARKVADYLLEHKKISNNDVLMGTPVRSSRLAAIIFYLEKEYGIRCESKTTYAETGGYIDCVYTLKD